MKHKQLTDNVSYPGLRDVPIVISGGASGIGEALVRAFAAQNARVGFVDIMDDAGKSLANDLIDANRIVRFINCDITDTVSYQAALEEFAREHGGCRVLVNNAANDIRHNLADINPDDYFASIAINLGHAFFASQAVIPGMIEAGGGSIINLGSISWMQGAVRLPVYATAKAGMQGLTRSLAGEFGKHGIRVNTLVPGWVMTKKQLNLWVDAESEKQIDRSQFLAGRVMPDDIAAMALYLASDQSRMCTSQNFIVDGGWV